MKGTRIIILFTFGVNILGWSNCSILKKKQKIPGVKITSTFPHISLEGKLLFYDTFHTVVYYNQNQVLYNSTYGFNYKPKNIMNEKADELRFYNFAYTIGNKYGILLDTNKSNRPIKVLVDSMLKKEWINTVDIYSNFKKSIVSLLNKDSNANLGTSTYSYSFVRQSDSTFKGTMLFEYNKNLSDISYSFSKILDSSMKMKLWKVEIVNNARYLKEYEMNIEKIKQLYLMEKVNAVNEKEVLKLFEMDKEINYNK